MFRDLILLLQQGLGLAREKHLEDRMAFTIGGVIAAVLCFFLCSWFTRLWNRQFQATASHYVWCGLAALVTILLASQFGLKAEAQEANRLYVEWGSAGAVAAP